MSNQVFVSKGYKVYNKWYSNNWEDNDKVINNEYNPKTGRITVACKDVTNMGFMFYNCRDLILLDLSNFDTTEVDSMLAAFYNCSNLVLLNVSNLNTSKVDRMGSMFSNCHNLTTLDLSSFDTSNVN